MKLAAQPYRNAPPWFLQWIKDQARFSDIQDPEQLSLAGRVVTIPTLFTYIGDTGKAASQRLLPTINAGNKSSVQSAQPLTAADVGSTATITVAAHNVRYGSGVGLVSYNGGSITGLAFSTLYYVYASDPNLNGGAVTYLATTTATTVTSNDGFYYLGSVTTPADGGGGTGGGWGGGGGGGGNPIP